jgi:mRNA-degrading endonuclease RelE of RelBE toxin-antitoxin system
VYVLKFTNAALADIKTIPQRLKGPLKKALLEKVAVEPHDCSHELHEELNGYRSFTWREYRFVYRVFDDLKAVVVVGLGLRSAKSKENIYRRLETLVRTGKLAQGMLFSLRGFTKGEGS